MIETECNRQFSLLQQLVPPPVNVNVNVIDHDDNNNDDDDDDDDFTADQSSTGGGGGGASTTGGTDGNFNGTNSGNGNGGRSDAFNDGDTVSLSSSKGPSIPPARQAPGFEKAYATASTAATNTNTNTNGGRDGHGNKTETETETEGLGGAEDHSGTGGGYESSIQRDGKGVPVFDNIAYINVRNALHASLDKYSRTAEAAIEQYRQFGSSVGTPPDKKVKVAEVSKDIGTNGNGHGRGNANAMAMDEDYDDGNDLQSTASGNINNKSNKSSKSSKSSKSKAESSKLEDNSKEEKDRDAIKKARERGLDDNYQAGAGGSGGANNNKGENEDDPLMHPMTINVCGNIAICDKLEAEAKNRFL